MFKITLPADRAVIDMAAVARAFGITTQELEDAIHVGTISRWFEVGEGDADDKPHQIFASEKLRRRVDVDQEGKVHSAGEYDANLANPLPNRNESLLVRHDHIRAGRTVGTGLYDNPHSIRQSRLDALLDDALDKSFPASDPVAISFETQLHAVHRDG